MTDVISVAVSVLNNFHLVQLLPANPSHTLLQRCCLAGVRRREGTELKELVRGLSGDPSWASWRAIWKSPMNPSCGARHRGGFAPAAAEPNDRPQHTETRSNPPKAKCVFAVSFSMSVLSFVRCKVSYLLLPCNYWAYLRYRFRLWRYTIEYISYFHKIVLKR